MAQLSYPYVTTGKTIALTIWTFVGKVMSLLFNMLSRFIIAFLPRSKHLLISWLQSPSAVILEPKKIKSVTVSIKQGSRHQRIDAFELWCGRRLKRVPWNARRSNQSILKKSVLNIYWKDWCWSWSSSTLATWWEALTHWKRPWCWERFKVGGKRDDKGWDGWMLSLTQGTWV